MSAKLHHIHSEPTSSFTPEQRAAILGEARQHIAEAKADPRPTNTEVRIDPMQRWRREADEQSAAWEAERRQAVDAEQRRQQRQHRQANASKLWADYVANQIKIAIETEREHAEALLTELVAVLMQRQQAVEAEMKALRKELSSWRPPS